MSDNGQKGTALVLTASGLAVGKLSMFYGILLGKIIVTWVAPPIQHEISYVLHHSSDNSNHNSKSDDFPVSTDRVPTVDYQDQISNGDNQGIARKPQVNNLNPIPSNHLGVPPEKKVFNFPYKPKNDNEKAIYEFTLSAIKSEKLTTANQASQKRLEQVSLQAAKKKQKELLRLSIVVPTNITVLIASAAVARANAS